MLPRLCPEPLPDFNLHLFPVIDHSYECKGYQWVPWFFRTVGGLGKPLEVDFCEWFPNFAVGPNSQHRNKKGWKSKLIMQITTIPPSSTSLPIYSIQQTFIEHLLYNVPNAIPGSETKRSSFTLAEETKYKKANKYMRSCQIVRHTMEKTKAWFKRWWREALFI